MSDSGELSPRHVTAAIEAARAALRELDAPDTPAVLRKVRASSARRLPPPLARVLLERLRDDDWLRSKVLDAGGDWDVSAEKPDQRASALLLLQPDGWEDQLLSIVGQSDELRMAAEAEALRGRIESLEGELAGVRDKVKQLTRTIEEQRAEEARLRATLKAAVADQRRPDADQLDLAAQLATLRDEKASLVADLGQADGRIERLKADLLRARRARNEEGAGPVATRSWGGRDPLELARQLDSLTAAARPDAPPVRDEPGEEPRGRFELPAGVAPDSPAAVEWLLGRETPVSLIVDGYNVTWLMYQAGFSTAGARNDLVRRLARLKRSAVGPLRVVVVFDSQYGTPEPTLGGPVEVRFAGSADDEVRRLATETSGDVAVVSTDREVREGSEGKGVLVLWSEALVAARF